MFVRWLLRLPGWAILAAPAAACLLLLWLSLGDPYLVRLTGPWHALENYESALRPYLARNAFVNSVWLMLLVPATGLLLATPLARHLPTSDRSSALMGTLCLLPVIFPAPLAALAWRPLFADRLFFTHAESALLATGLVQFWRVLPLQCALLAVTLRHGRPLGEKLRATAFAFLAAAYLIWVDVGTPLLLGAGEPYNASHTFASWTFQTQRVARLWGASAASAILLALGAAILASAALRLRPRIDGYEQRGSTSAMFLLAILVLLPAALLVAQAVPTLTPNTVTVLLNAGFLSWLANAAWTAALATALAWIALASLRSIPFSAPAPVFALLVFALAAHPVLYAPLAWLHAAGIATVGIEVDARMLLPLLHAALIAAALLPFRRSGSHPLPAIATLAFALSLAEFTADLSLDPARHAHLPAAGIALYLGRRITEPAALPLALLIVYAITALAIYLLIRRLLPVARPHEQHTQIDSPARLPL